MQNPGRRTSTEVRAPVISRVVSRASESAHEEKAPPLGSLFPPNPHPQFSRGEAPDKPTLRGLLQKA